MCCVTHAGGGNGVEYGIGRGDSPSPPFPSLLAGLASCTDQVTRARPNETRDTAARTSRENNMGSSGSQGPGLPMAPVLDWRLKAGSPEAMLVDWLFMPKLR